MDNDAWVQPFLQNLAKCGIVSRAADAACTTTLRVKARYAKDADFAAAYDDALERAIDGAEAEAWRRGVHGYSEPLTYQGQITYVQEQFTDPETGLPGYRRKLDADGNPIPVTIQKFSDPMLTLVLKGRRKKVFADRTEITGADGGAVQMDNGKRAERMAALMALAEQRRKAANEHDDIA